jgi:hypothetical protein
MITSWHDNKLDNVSAQVLTEYASRNGSVWFCDDCQVSLHSGYGCLGHTYDTNGQW